MLSISCSSLLLSLTWNGPATCRWSQSDTSQLVAVFLACGLTYRLISASVPTHGTDRNIVFHVRRHKGCWWNPTCFGVPHLKLEVLCLKLDAPPLKLDLLPLKLRAHPLKLVVVHLKLEVLCFTPAVCQYGTEHWHIWGGMSKVWQWIMYNNQWVYWSTNTQILSLHKVTHLHKTK